MAGHPARWRVCVWAPNWCSVERVFRKSEKRNTIFRRLCEAKFFTERLSCPNAAQNATFRISFYLEREKIEANDVTTVCKLAFSGQLDWTLTFVWAKNWTAEFQLRFLCLPLLLAQDKKKDQFAGSAENSRHVAWNWNVYCRRVKICCRNVHHLQKSCTVLCGCPVHVALRPTCHSYSFVAVLEPTWFSNFALWRSGLGMLPLCFQVTFLCKHAFFQFPSVGL